MATAKRPQWARDCPLDTATLGMLVNYLQQEGLIIARNTIDCNCRGDRLSEPTLAVDGEGERTVLACAHCCAECNDCRMPIAVGYDRGAFEGAQLCANCVANSGV